MVIHVSPDGTPCLQEVACLSRLKVVMDAAPERLDGLRGQLAPSIELPDADTAWIAAALIVRLSARQDDAAWMDSWNATVAWARSRGWTTVDGARIRAHVEWLDQGFRQEKP
jgi:hypothetical protein